MEGKVSVIVPSLNEKNYIRNCIESLAKNNYPTHLLEILIVDGFSSDGTIDIIKGLCKEFSNVSLIPNKDRITPVALNLGILNSSGDYIMIASAHSWFPPDYISKLVSCITKDNASVVGGVLETKVNNINATSQAIAIVLSNKFGVGNSSFRIGVTGPLSVDTVPFGLYKRSVFQEVGYYNEKLIRNHDIELSKRIIKKGLKIILLPDPVCYYYARDNYKDLAKNNFQNGMWNILTAYITKSFSSLSLRHYVPLLFILTLIVSFLLATIVNPVLYSVTLSIFSIYLITISVISLRLSHKKDMYMEIIWSFIVIHFSYGFGSLTGISKIHYLLRD